MHKSFKYRLYPTKSQERLLEQTLNECRWLYNHLLEERKTAWEQQKKSISRYDQITALPALKSEHISLKSVHSQVLQNVAVRIDLAFEDFFRRVQSGGAPGHPRFRGAHRYDSFTFPQAPVGCKLVGKWLHLSKIGSVQVVLHRELEGTPKTATIKRSSTGKWYAIFSCEWEPTTLPKVEPQIGVDVGIKSFATFSDGGKITSPRFFKHEERALAKVQRKLSKAPKGSKERKKQRKAVARVHERTAWKRTNFCHQESRKIVDTHQVIVVEDLAINRMMRDKLPGMAKSISDAAWSQFSSYLAYKAEWAGRQFVAVNPAHTSQTCSGCGYREPKELAERTHNCKSCGLVLDRDHNAAINILALGLQRLGPVPVEA